MVLEPPAASHIPAPSYPPAPPYSPVASYPRSPLPPALPLVSELLPLGGVPVYNDVDTPGTEEGSARRRLIHASVGSATIVVVVLIVRIAIALIPSQSAPSVVA